MEVTLPFQYLEQQLGARHVERGRRDAVGVRLHVVRGPVGGAGGEDRRRRMADVAQPAHRGGNLARVRRRPASARLEHGAFTGFGDEQPRASLQAAREA
ncbi:MAG: hypothetical protein J2P24_00830 [Streptosporangiales bacterium]|nr:hypothetical protein [Streptosporangiales bacterium]